MNFFTKKSAFDAVCSHCRREFVSFNQPREGAVMLCKSCRIPMIDFSRSLYFSRFSKALTAKLGVPVTVVRVDGETYDFLAGGGKPRVLAIAKLQSSDERKPILTALAALTSKDAQVKEVIKAHVSAMGVEVPFT